MKKRVKWNCPGCKRNFAVPNAVGLTLCPDCTRACAGVAVTAGMDDPPTCTNCLRSPAADDSGLCDDCQRLANGSERVFVSNATLAAVDANTKQSGRLTFALRNFIVAAVTVAVFAMFGSSLLDHFHSAPKNHESTPWYPAPSPVRTEPAESTFPSKPEPFLPLPYSEAPRGMDAGPVADLNDLYDELQDERRAGMRPIRSILVSRGITASQIKSIARSLHASDRESQFRFFDDKSQFEAFRLSELHYPDRSYPCPQQWANKHFLAVLNKFGNRWVLRAESGGGHLAGSDFIIATFVTE